MKLLINGFKIAVLILLSFSYLESFSISDLELINYQHLVKEVENGKIYTKLEAEQEQGVIFVMGLIDADVEKTWQALNEDKVYSDIIYTHIIERNSDFVLKKRLLNYPWPFSDKLTIYKERIYNDIYAKEWKEVGGDIPVNRGAIRLFPYKDKTIAIFKISFHPGIGIVPKWLIDQGMKYKAPKIIKELRNKVKELQSG